uniref:Uncharacterized protein n=1 Tax=Gallus gallus TaxID=9031 RepID=A0A8V0WZK4_CHICK
MAGGIVRSPVAWRGGAALLGKVARQEFSANVIREEEPLWTRSALRSMIFHRKLLRFFPSRSPEGRCEVIRSRRLWRTSSWPFDDCWREVCC